jgi:hypothetical protein
MFAAIALGLLLACDGPNGKVDPVSVQWMDWPAEVNAGQPFRTRLVVWGVCAINPRFRPGAHADQSAVTFAPYYLVDNDQIFCANLREVTLLQVGAIDTAGTAPGLAAPASRTYEMRAGAEVFFARAEESIPVRHFGNVIVRPTGADPSQRNGGGTVFLLVDSVGCLRLSPLGFYNPNSALVLEDQADTTGLNYAFVRGYIHEAAAPVCGQTRVFHLVSRN